MGRHELEQEEADLLDADIASVEAQISAIENNLGQYISSRIQKIQASINGIPGNGSKFPGNSTMHNYLQSLKQEFQQNPAKRAQQELQNLKDHRDILIARRDQ